MLMTFSHCQPGQNSSQWPMGERLYISHYQSPEPSSRPWQGILSYPVQSSMAVQIPIPSENLLQLFKIKEYFQNKKEAEHLVPQIKEQLQFKKKKTFWKKVHMGIHTYVYVAFRHSLNSNIFSFYLLQCTFDSASGYLVTGISWSSH